MNSLLNHMQIIKLGRKKGWIEKGQRSDKVKFKLNVAGDF